ncbi:uncharacterized protein DNG_01322 [Cephalotrichum gorgonifer]|uniref:Uncharacterized protein n=1 Tax=Cephalotrichum gorgonifer TaxID=2041049 RepID=A0AAE8MRD4_9PEZI|nr:uncharacterized protein DNG_01322 [Cephalotrichum gorgonifer]
MTCGAVPVDDVFPHTLHARHRPYSDPGDLERFLTFRVPHRIRYTGEDGIVAFDGVVQVNYEFTTVDSSIRFQGDVRGKTLLDYYDVDVIWSDVNTRTDRFGSVRGLGLVQRLKLWRDNYTNLHSITVFANRSSRQYHEYDIHWFEPELRSRDEREKRVRLNARGRRSSTSEVGRRFSFNRIRPRQRSAPEPGNGASTPTALANPLDIRYLGIQFTSRSDYRQFIEAWAHAHRSDGEFHGVPFPQHRAELESPQIHPYPAELDAGLLPVLESDSEEDDDT